MSKHVNLQIDISIIQKKIANILLAGGEPNAAIIAEKIVYHLEPTEMGLAAVMLAIMGIEEKTNWIIGDECLLDPSKVGSWHYDKKKTEEAGLFHKGHLKGKITAVNFRNKKAITFEFDGVDAYKTTEISIKKISVEVDINDIFTDKDLLLARPDLAGLM